MYTTHNERKFVVAERFIRTIKNKIYKSMTSISKNVYIDKLDDIVHKYNNKKHRTIKMKPIDVKGNTYIDFSKEVNDNDSKFKVGDHVRISKYKNIFAKGYTPNWSKEIFVIKKINNAVSWTYVINVKVDLSNYARNTDLKNVSRVDVGSFALKSNLASLKTEVDKIDADKLKTVPVDLAKLSNVVKNDVVKKTEYNKLVTKVDSINTTNFVKKPSSLVKKTDFNTKVTEIEDKIPSITGLATNSALTAVEKKQT